MNLNNSKKESSCPCLSNSELLLCISNNWPALKRPKAVVLEHLGNCRACQENERRVRARFERLLGKFRAVLKPASPPIVKNPLLVIPEVHIPNDSVKLVLNSTGTSMSMNGSITHGKPALAEVNNPNSHSNLDCRRIPKLLAQIGCSDFDLARSAIYQIRSLWKNNRDGLHNCLRQLMSNPIRWREKQMISADLLQGSPEAVAYKEYKQDVTPEDANRWLKDRKTRFFRVVETNHRRLLVALVKPHRKQFQAAMFRFGDQDFVLFVRNDLAEQTCLEAVIHELNHAFDFILEAPPLQTNPSAISNDLRIASHAQIQRRVDQIEKQRVARWAAEEIPLPNGAGVYFDTGSQCDAVWEAIRHQTHKNDLSSLTVCTNSGMILRSWLDAQHAQQLPDVLRIQLEFLGGTFDFQHQACYGDAAAKKLLSGGFMPHAMFIGTSGLGFDGGIHFGSHAGPAEQLTKELLFRCRAKVRCILTTAQKIGSASGCVFDILTLKGLDTRAPIYILTTAPEPKSSFSKQFEDAKAAFQGPAIRKKLHRLGLRVRWVTIDAKSEIPKATELIEMPKPERVLKSRNIPFVARSGAKRTTRNAERCGSGGHSVQAKHLKA